MERTIKFRGKSVANKRWVYGSFVLCTHNAIADICDIVADNNDMTRTPVLSYTVGQFVGLHDDNDREIYEGDIIHIKCGSVNKDFGIVKWNTNGYFFIDDTFSNKEKDANPIGNFFESLRMSRDDIEITVNGNIHDRPKAIKDGEVIKTKDVESICLALGWNYNEQTKKYTKALPDGFCAILYRVSETRFFIEVVNHQGIPCVYDYVRKYSEIEQILEDFE